MNKTEFNDFVNYVLSFYNPIDGVYPMQDLTRKDVELATYIRLGRCSVNGVTFEADTFERYEVRDILIDEFMYNYENECKDNK